MRISRLTRRLSQAKLVYRWKKDQDPHRNSKATPGIIVSLTSFPARIKTAWIAVESILRQTARPERIILVLNSNEFGSNKRLPRELERQKERGLEILWIDQNLKSYGKLIPVKTAYPESCIATIDDDIIYPEHMLASLIDAYQANPLQIVGWRGYEMQIDINGRPLPYTNWIPANSTTPSGTCFLTGAGGVLYPPNSLPWELACNSMLFTSLCPTADDIWFWAMSLLNGCKRHCLGEHNLQEIKRLIKTSRLSRNNVSRGGNDRQLQLVINHFNLDSLLSQSQKK